DFGLSAAKGEVGSSGTMAYMAPEFFQEKPISEPADLYAVGIMAYEIFVGHHPFNTLEVSKLFQEILYAPPDMDRLLEMPSQAVSEGGIRYQVWREALRRLSLQSDLNPFEASVLKPLVPDIATLVDFPVEDAPPLEPQANQDRLLSVIESIFERQQQAIMLVF